MRGFQASSLARQTTPQPTNGGLPLPRGRADTPVTGRPRLTETDWTAIGSGVAQDLLGDPDKEDSRRVALGTQGEHR